MRGRQFDKPLYIQCLSVDARSEQERHSFLHTMCRFSDGYQLRRREKCEDCNLCDPLVFTKEQKALPSLKRKFIAKKRFGLISATKTP